MSNTKKTNNEDSINQNTYNNSIGSFSKKSTFRQMTKPLLNTKSVISIPRLNELLNDHIFQYYFRSHFNSKEYSKFKLFTEVEKINIMIDLYFYIMDKANNNIYIEEEQINEYDIENDNENENNGIDKLLDNLLLLDSNQRRMNVLDKMKEYKLFSLNENYSERFNKILNKYKNGTNNDNTETLNYIYNYNKNGDNNDLNNGNNINNKMNMGSLTNINYNSKPQLSTKFNIKTLSNNNNGDFPSSKYKTQGNMNIDVNDDLRISNEDDNNAYNIYNEIIGPYKRSNVYDKINLSTIKLLKLGKLRKKKIIIDENSDSNNYIEYLIRPDEFEIKSKKK